MLRRGFTRETAIRRDAKGQWWNGGEPIDHVGVSRSFDAWIDRAPDGRYCLVNSIHWVFVAIEGPPFFVRSVELEGDDAWLTLSGGLREKLDASTLRLGPDEGLYCDVRGGRVPARFDDHATHQLADRLDADDVGPYFRLGGGVVRPATVDDPLAGWEPSRGDVESAKVESAKA
ncbi:MAG: hypothetical protein KC586_03075 [Myxococcales bacterium]|nr:hypothetical protein [Myxococcales bacterium]